MLVKAPAKINLHLEVIKKRKDGFHELKTVFQLVNLYDEISFTVSRDIVELKETSKEIKDNLILRAALMLKEKTNSTKGVAISLNKRIPIQRGLGGGSSDAAATLIALNFLWETNLTKKELLKIALELGSDVPFFIHGQAAWAEGRGEKFFSLNLNPEWYLLAFPRTKISTQHAFEDFVLHSKNNITLKEFLSGKNINSFTNWAISKYPEIKKIYSLLENVGLPRLSGTGSTLFVSFSKKEKAERALREYPEGVLVKSLDHSPLRQFIE